MPRIEVGVLGATGMVGQRFALQLACHRNPELIHAEGRL
jgi:aspartate-semialdehyde dehydrogenase